VNRIDARGPRFGEQRAFATLHPLFYLAQCNLPNTTFYSRHKKPQSKFTLHTHVHTHTQGDYSHSLRSQITVTDLPIEYTLDVKARNWDSKLLNKAIQKETVSIDRDV
jgi:hypothetical protein